MLPPSILHQHWHQHQHQQVQEPSGRPRPRPQFAGRVQQDVQEGHEEIPQVAGPSVAGAVPVGRAIALLAPSTALSGRGLAPSDHGMAPSGSSMVPSDHGLAPLGHGPALSGRGPAPSGRGPAPSDTSTAPSDHGPAPSGPSTVSGAIGGRRSVAAASTSAAGSGTTLVLKKKGKKTHLLSIVPLPPFIYDDDVEVIPLTDNVKKYCESHPIPFGCLVSTIYGTIIDIKRPTKPHPDLTPFEKQRHNLFGPRCPTMTSTGYREMMAIRRQEFFADEEFVAVGLSPNQRRLPLSPPSFSSSGSGSSGDGSGSEGQSSGGGLQYETDNDENDDDDDEKEEEEEEEDEEGQEQGDVIELSSDAGQHADQMEVDEGQAQGDKLKGQTPVMMNLFFQQIC
ncbi:hypothetical protein AcV7_006055 [Taiwanofungus camphoratus]|nr:hypothetical protein AcV7_006055 [Antrodia cinnamomea]